MAVKSNPIHTGSNPNRKMIIFQDSPTGVTVLSLASGSLAQGLALGGSAPEHLALKATGFDHKTSMDLPGKQIPLLEGTCKVYKRTQICRGKRKQR